MRKLLLPLIFASLFLAACSGTPAQLVATPVSPRPTPNAAELELSDPAKTIEVNAGNDFTISVKTKAFATDYHWEEVEALDHNVVTYVWKNYVPDKSGDPNSSGKDVWRFKAVAPGKTTITLGYYQGETVVASQTMIFAVVVK